MTINQSPSAEQPDRGAVLIDMTAAADVESFGARLRTARQARGLGLEACAHALRLPIRVLRELENGEYAKLDYQVYLTSYLTKYGRQIGVDEAVIQAELSRLKSDQTQPALVATGGISHSRYLLENYARAATYVVLTAVIAVPAIWLGMRGAFDRDVSHLAPLDAAPVAQQEQAAPAVSSTATGLAVAGSVAAPATVSSETVQAPAAAVASSADQQPLLASMTPFPSLGNEGAATTKPAMTAPQVAGVGAHSLVLNVPNDSWVEITRKDGSRLEYGLLRGGTAKTYQSDQPLDVRIGNANGAQVTLDGQPMSLDSYRRANVAHFHVDVQDGKAAPASF